MLGGPRCRSRREARPRETSNAREAEDTRCLTSTCRIEKAVYIALGILPDGTKEILGIWIEQTEGAKFWLRVMNELKNRGLGDILIAVVDGLKGFPEAITAVFPDTVVQTCIVHLIRHSLEFVSWKDRKAVVPALRAIYRAKDADAGRQALEAFEAGDWG